MESAAREPEATESVPGAVSVEQALREREGRARRADERERLADGHERMADERGERFYADIAPRSRDALRRSYEALRKTREALDLSQAQISDTAGTPQAGWYRVAQRARASEGATIMEGSAPGVG